jgi:SAM-dependent methyltransferase
MKETIKSIPVVGEIARALYRRIPKQLKRERTFPGSAAYWEERYRTGGTSGAGSYAFLAEFKAEVLNAFVAEHRVRSVIEFGCGDGNQLRLAKYPSYLGFDVSRSAVARCRQLFAGDSSKSFRPVAEYAGERAELALSLDVIFHLVEDAVFEEYMRRLFAAAERYAIVYSSNTSSNLGVENEHVKHREFTRWVAQQAAEFRMVRHVPNRYPYAGDHHAGSFADFFVFERS